MKSTAVTDVPCTLEARLADEAPMVRGMARRLTAEAGDRSASRGEQVSEPTVTVHAVLAGLRDDDMLRREAAAYVAGRCRAEGEAADVALTQAVVSALEETDDSVLRIELAMAAALRGVSGGADALRAAAGEDDIFAEPHKAATYLARLGEPTGWPAIVRAASGDVAHYRLMALRALPHFRPFAGQTVQGEAVDPRAIAVKALADDEVIVRVEAPAVLERLGVGDLEPLLRPVAESDPSPEVKAAAEAVLERLGK